jgi:hypothetical protein
MTVRWCCMSLNSSKLELSICEAESLLANQRIGLRLTKAAEGVLVSGHRRAHVGCI